MQSPTPSPNWGDFFNNNSQGLGSALGQGLGLLFDNWKNPYDKSQQQLGEIPGKIAPYYDPYINAGRGSIPQLQTQYGNLLNNPGGQLNKIGEGYQQSPGLQFAIKQALQGANHAAAAGGMAGSPQHEFQNMDIASNLANRDYDTWLSHVMGLYGRGLGGEENLYSGGMNMSADLGKQISDLMQKQSDLSYGQQEAQNQHGSGGWGAFAGSLGPLIAQALPLFL